jgi:hypothetical protein
MSIGNLKSEGNKGNNFPWQLKMLTGQQCACDYLKEIDLNTDNIEPLLLQILTAIQSGYDYEAMLVVDANDITWLEIRIYNPDTGTFDPPVYYPAGSNTPGIPLAPITYINPNTYLAQIVSNTSAIAISTAAIDTKLTSVARTPNFLRPSGSLGTVTAGVFSMSFASVGTGNATVGGMTLKPGETINFDAGALNNTLGAVAYDTTTTGSELIIITLT